VQPQYYAFISCAGRENDFSPEFKVLLKRIASHCLLFQANIKILIE